MEMWNSEKEVIFFNASVYLTSKDKVTGKRINRGGGHGLEVRCKYRISGQEKAVDWIKRTATTFLQEH